MILSPAGTGFGAAWDGRARAAMLRTAARAVAPRVRRRPSEWAAENIILSSKQTDRPGPFNPDYLPWIRDTMDLLFDEPAKRGLVVKKMSQGGFSVAFVATMLALVDCDPGPMLYLTDKQDKATTYANTYFWSWVQANPRLREKFSGENDPTHRELLFHKEFEGGFLDFFATGTESSVTSEGRRYVFADEWQLANEAFPRASGDLFQTILARAERYQDTSQLYFFGHPRYAGEDIDALYEDLSDQREWVWDCPHCGKPVHCAWDACVVFGGVLPAEHGDTPRPDPATARFVCPACREEITDAQRCRAVWPPRLGGTGRYVCTLTPVEAAQRRFAGVAVHRLCDPKASVRELATRFSLCRTDGEQQAFRNKMGEAVPRSRGLVVVEDVSRCIAETDRLILPGGPRGAQLLAAGVDVQGPDEGNPTLVTSVMAFAPTGHAWVVGLEMCRGWGTLLEYLRTFGVDRAGEHGQRESRMGLTLCAIDCGWATGQVLSQSRAQLFSAVNSAQIQLLPLRFEKYVKAAQPYILPNEQKRTDPARPWLGPLERYDLHRHTWVNRAMRRWMDGRVTVLCRTPKELIGHVTANTLVPKRDKFANEREDLEWQRMKGRSDDWLMAMAYAEAGAAIKLGLDTLHEMVAPAAPQAGSGRSEGWVSRHKSQGSWFKR